MLILLLRSFPLFPWESFRRCFCRLRISFRLVATVSGDLGRSATSGFCKRCWRSKNDLGKYFFPFPTWKQKRIVIKNVFVQLFLDFSLNFIIHLLVFFLIQKFCSFWIISFLAEIILEMKLKFWINFHYFRLFFQISFVAV